MYLPTYTKHTNECFAPKPVLCSNTVSHIIFQNVTPHDSLNTLINSLISIKRKANISPHSVWWRRRCQWHNSRLSANLTTTKALNPIFLREKTFTSSVSFLLKNSLFAMPFEEECEKEVLQKQFLFYFWWSFNFFSSLFFLFCDLCSRFAQLHVVGLSYPDSRLNGIYTHTTIHAYAIHQQRRRKERKRKTWKALGNILLYYSQFYFTPNKNINVPFLLVSKPNIFGVFT